MLKDPPDIARIVAERAHHQPDLKPELKAFLGESYENLLSSDVYAQWARDQQEHIALVAAPRPDAAPDGAEAAHAAMATVVIDRLDREAEDFLDHELRARLRRMDERNAETRRMHRARPRRYRCRTSRTRIRLRTPPRGGGRWGESTDIPDDAREALLELLVAGTTARQGGGCPRRHAVGCTDVPRTAAPRRAGAHQGEGRAARWLAGPEPESGDAS